MISSKGLTLVHQGGNPSVAGSGKSTVYTMSDGLYIDGTKLAASGGGAAYNNMTISSNPITTNVSQNNWNTNGYYNLFVGGAGITINGILQDPNCRVKTLTNNNTTIGNIQTITHLSTAPSSAYSRIYISPLCSEYKLLPGETVQLIYSQSDTYWTLSSSRLGQNEWMPLNMAGLLTPGDNATSVSSSNAYYKQSYTGPGGIVEICFNMIGTRITSSLYTVNFTLPSFCGTVNGGAGLSSTILGTCTQNIAAGNTSGIQGCVLTTSQDNVVLIHTGGENNTYQQCYVRFMYTRKT